MPFFIPGIRSLWSRKRKRSGADEKKVAQKRSKTPARARDAAVEGAEERAGRGYTREAGALVLIATGLYCALALASYRADPMRPEVHGDDWVGPVGAVLAH